MKTKSTTIKILVILVFVTLTCIYLLPVYVMINASLKTKAEVDKREYLVPSPKPQFQNYPNVLLGGSEFKSTPLGRPLLNSTIISVSVTLLSAFFGGLAGYYLSRSKTRFTRILFILVGIALYLPYQAFIIPLVFMMSKLNLLLSYWGMILSYLILNLPLASVLLGTFFLSLPRELEEAAEVDGASRIQTFFRIVTPISWPAYASVGIIIFTQVWNEFFLALVLSSPTTRTVQVVMAEAQGTTLVLYNQQMVAALVSVSIPLLFFIFLGRYFIRGILAGALKG